MDSERRNIKILCGEDAKMKKMKKIFTNWRVVLLLFFIVLSLILINPQPGNEGVTIRSVAKNSSADIAGFKAPLQTDKPMFREVITEINGEKVKNVDDFMRLTSDLEGGDILRFKSKSNYEYANGERTFSFFKKDHSYTLTVASIYNIVTLNETETITTEKTVVEEILVNGTLQNMTRTVTENKVVPKTEKVPVGIESLGLDVYNAPTTNIKKGLDLQGGTRVLLKPEEGSEVNDADLDIIISNLKQRLNVYGLSDIVIRPVSDLAGNKLITVEVAGANENEVKELISSQGKFEAKIGNSTVFLGGQDVRNVCRSPDCSFASSPFNPCGMGNDGQWHCQFMFQITLSQEAAQRQADATANLDVVMEGGEGYLSEPLRLYLDNELVDELRIGVGLQGRAETGISISGPGSGETQQAAVMDSANNMKKLQTVLITGSLPVKLDIVKIDTVSPALGSKFLRNALLVGLGAILSVALVVFIRYRQAKVAVPVFFTMLSEVTMILGFAAIAGWNLDLAAIAGIIIAVGTGVDDQIVIVDETTRGKKDSATSWKDKLKRAFFIIFAAFFTTFVAMLPLMWAGAGLLRGFAITTLIGITAGVLVSRPAFANMIEILLKD